MTGFIDTFTLGGPGPTIAIKDTIDIAGHPTRAASRALADAPPAAQHADVVRLLLDAGWQIAGKANMHELAFGMTGINDATGTPVNPQDATRIPGGSSSGSAVAVASDEADIAFGSDTGGSVRLPSACCGTAGLKTTHGRISLDGVWPLAPSFDTIGPMARDIAGLVAGMQLLEPGFESGTSAAKSIGRVRTTGDPVIEAAVDAALRDAGFEITEINWDDLAPANDAWTAIYAQEIWEADRTLFESDPDGIGEDVKGMITLGAALGLDGDAVRPELAAWRDAFLRIFDRVELLALPTMPTFAPRIDEITPESLLNIVIEMTKHMTVFNAAGTPCTAQPIPVAGSRLPASLQLVGPLNAEDLLLSTAAVVESAVG